MPDLSLFTLGCLGTANYFTTIPLFLLMAGLGISFVYSPDWPARRMNQAKQPLWYIRSGGVLIVIVALVLSAMAVHEARSDPHCRFQSGTASSEFPKSRR